MIMLRLVSLKRGLLARISLTGLTENDIRVKIV